MPANTTDEARTQKALKVLLRSSLVTESETTLPAAGWRLDGDLHFGLFITEQGKATIGLSERDEAEDTVPATGAATAHTSAREARSGSKKRMFGHLKINRAIATRYDQLDATPQNCAVPKQ